MSDTPRTDAASVSRAFIAREMDYYSHQFVLAGPMRDLERELTAAKAEAEALRADAERYRWLRTRTKETELLVYSRGTDLDESIDAARAALTKEKSQ